MTTPDEVYQYRWSLLLRYEDCVDAELGRRKGDAEFDLLPSD